MVDEVLYQVLGNDHTSRLLRGLGTLITLQRRRGAKGAGSTQLQAPTIVDPCSFDSVAT
jgi:hypothetical protein